MIVKRTFPPGTVRIDLDDIPVAVFEDGIMFEETDHGWVECPPVEIWWERIIEQATRKAKKVKSKYDDEYRYAWNGGFNPDVHLIPQPPVKYRFPIPGKEQTAAIHRKRERKEEEIRKRKEEEIRKRKEETPKSQNESVQGSLERSPYDLGRRPNQKRKYEPESDESNWNQKRSRRDANRKEKKDDETKTENETKTSLQQLYKYADSKCLV